MVFSILISGSALFAQQQALEPLDVFKLSYVSDPAYSPTGDHVAFIKNTVEIKTDRVDTDLWLANPESGAVRPLAVGSESDGSPVWSPDGARLAWVARRGETFQLMMRWMDAGEQSAIGTLDRYPGSLSFSPDGEWLAFSQFVPEKGSSIYAPASKPEGATWAAAPTYTEELVYRSDGAGELDPGHNQIFLMPASGGSPMQLTSGPYHHGGPLSWSPDSDYIYFSANRREDADDQPRNSEIYRVSLQGGDIEVLTERFGPDSGARISPDGSRIAWLGFDDTFQGHQQTELYVAPLSDPGSPTVLTASFDRSVGQIQWSPEGDHLWFAYDDEGHTKVGRVSLNGQVEEVVAGLAGPPVGRPYSGGDFSAGPNGSYAITQGDASAPPELAIGKMGGSPKKLTHYNQALFLKKKPGKVETFWTESSFDGQRVQGWIMYPPNFDPDKKYPMMLEIHGGPFTHYGDFFSMELQLYAARGYVVVYTNPRGSTGYGERFGNLIHHAYPGNDYDDLMSCVDHVIEKGFIDEDHLYVTGGSGGGVLTAWIVGKTDRFRAAVSAKPVINWYTHALTADGPAFFTRYWFPAMPWEDPDHYYKRSPISLVGNVTTPTMLMVGDKDYRTPLSEAEQFYRALKLRGIETALVRFPESSHGIANRPSQMLAKVGSIMGWMAKFGGPEEDSAQP